MYYPEIEMYDELEPAMEEYKTFSSNDNFTNSLIIKSDGYTTEYFYAGETYEEFERKCEEKASSSQHYGNNVTSIEKYLKAPAFKVFADFGKDYIVTPWSGGMGFPYDNSPYVFIFSKNVDFSLQPSDENTFIIGIFVDNHAGANIINGLKIGDSVKKVQETMYFEYTKGKVAGK